MSAREDDFDGIEEADGSEDDNVSGQWFKPGNYLVEIRKVKMITTRKKDRAFVIETKILESDNQEKPVGSRGDCMFMRSWDSYLRDVKKFCMAATGSVDKDVDKAGVAQIVSAQNPLEGVNVRVEVFQIKTSKGTDFTKHVWRNADEESEQAA